MFFSEIAVWVYERGQERCILCGKRTGANLNQWRQQS